jgi:uncharacterized membrane protein
MPDFHPFVVHFPVALLTFGALADLLGIMRRNATAAAVGWWSQVAGTAGVLAGIASGLAARERIAGQALPAQLETHEQLAFLTAAAFTALAIWRAGKRGKIPSHLYTAFLLASVLILWATAWYGGELVYRFGVGVAR